MSIPDSATYFIKEFAPGKFVTYSRQGRKFYPR